MNSPVIFSDYTVQLLKLFRSLQFLYLYWRRIVFCQYSLPPDMLPPCLAISVPAFCVRKPPRHLLGRVFFLSLCLDSPLCKCINIFCRQKCIFGWAVKCSRVMFFRLFWLKFGLKLPHHKYTENIVYSYLSMNVFILTWMQFDQHSCRGSCLCPNRGPALCLWSCDPGLCLFLVPSPFPSPALVPSPSRGPAALSPALALFPFPSVPAQTPASLSPSCPFLLRVSAEQNRNWFRQWHTRCGASTSLCRLQRSSGFQVLKDGSYRNMHQSVPSL